MADEIIAAGLPKFTDEVLNTCEARITAIIKKSYDELYESTVKDVIAENERLKAKYAEYEADKARLAAEMVEFTARREQFENEIRPYTDLEKERAEIAKNMAHIREERARLRLAAQKIWIEKDELEHERRRINAVDLTQI